MKKLESLKRLLSIRPLKLWWPSPIHCQSQELDWPVLPQSLGQSTKMTSSLAQSATQQTQKNVSPANNMSALDIQVGGGHYKKYKIQPVEFIHANDIPYFEGNVIKYVARWRDKNGIADLEKAKHYIDLLIELEKEKNV